MQRWASVREFFPLPGKELQDRAPLGREAKRNILRVPKEKKKANGFQSTAYDVPEKLFGKLFPGSVKQLQ